MPSLIAAGLALGLLLGMLEWWARRRFPRKERMPRGLFSPHPELGYVLTPGFCGSSSLGVEYRINSQGLRDREREGGPGSRRVVAVGNSYAMGAGEDFDQTFLALLERSLKCDVVKAGVGGYGTRHELVFYRECCRTYRPEVVLLLFAVATDFRNNLAQTRGVVRRGRLLPSYHQALLKVLLERHCALYVALMRFSRRGRLGALLSRLGLVRGAYPQQVAMLRRQYGEYQQRALDQTLAALKGFAHTCREDGCRLAVCLVPDRLQVEEEQLGAILRDLDLPPDELEAAKPNRLLAEFCAAEDLHCLDLLPLFRGMAARGQSPYRGGDIHWNLAGRAAAAQEVAQGLRFLLSPDPLRLREEPAGI